MRIEKKEHYRVGDKVLIRSWDDMAQTYGVIAGNINMPTVFVSSMKYFCGKVLTIANISSPYTMEEDSMSFYFDPKSIAGKVVKQDEKIDYFHSIATTWCDDDIRSALKIEGIEVSDEAIRTVASEEFVRFFNETLQERANEMIVERIAVLQKNGAFNEWICTDPDCKQYCKPCGDRIFKFIEKVQFDLCDNEASQKDCSIHTATIDLADYDQKEIEDCIRSYGYETLDAVESIYGDAGDRIIAECIFESLISLDTTELRTEEEADTYIENYVKEK